ncbi:hypothetical protein chiPu_0006501 [Chiloscyllium punctatum]|uniref:Uncharacterized protein n=1 Tax=Chiloscyllium punctatum TaxID=137246 RepID=A0A401SCF7_CHIPU|nr:hypothetical protein [Chiloscyllium punctatum]
MYNCNVVLRLQYGMVSLSRLVLPPPVDRVKPWNGRLGRVAGSWDLYPPMRPPHPRGVSGQRGQECPSGTGTRL